MKFGDRLKELRISKNISQEKLADLCGVSRSTIANYEVYRNMPDDSIKYKLCEIFECSMDYLMCRTNDKQSQETIELNNEDIDFIQNIKKLDENDKSLIRKMLDALLDKQKNDEKKEN